MKKVGLIIIIIIILTLNSCFIKHKYLSYNTHIQSLSLDACSINIIKNLKKYVNFELMENDSLQRHLLENLETGQRCDYCGDPGIGVDKSDSIIWLTLFMDFERLNENIIIGKIFEIDYKPDTVINVICRSGEFDACKMQEGIKLIRSYIEIYPDSTVVKIGR